MNEEQVIEVIDRLIGDITPIGDSNYDAKAKENLKKIINITNHYFIEIYKIAETYSYMASVQECQKEAKDFLIGLKEDLNESL